MVKEANVFLLAGYDGQYKKRTGEKHDGCATFWRMSKLELHDYRCVEYNVAPNSSLDRDNVGKCKAACHARSGLSAAYSWFGYEISSGYGYGYGYGRK